MLDSGANKSIAGSTGIEKLRSLGYITDESKKAVVYTAAKAPHEIAGTIKVPCEFRDRIKTIDFLVCPSLPQDFILGVDFWTKFEVQVQNKQGVWHCSSLETESSQSTDGKTHGLVDYDHLQPDQKQIALQMIDQFKKLANDNELGRTSILTQEIDTGDAIPTVQRYYPVSPSIQARMSSELDRMIALDVVERSKSPWRSPVVLVKKANGKDRLCIDCRKVNSVTTFDSYPLPYISGILDSLGQTKYLSSIDLKDAFWQIPLTPSAKEKTAFVVPGRGLWQMKVVPFGMKNSAQAMQRLVDRLFSGEVGIFTYLDDIIIVTETFDEHIQLLELVMHRLETANLTINFDKCQFFRPSLKYLGFIVDSLGLHTDPNKVNSINEYPQPKTTTEVKRFMGMASWYRRFIKDFATIAAPIHDVVAGVAKGKPIKWTSDAQKAFETLKKALVNSPVLATPDFSKPFTIHCDASNSGVGAVISQGPEEAPIAYASKKLTHEHKNYTTTEKECFAVLFGVEKFRPYIEGSKFTVVTDHSALKWMLHQQNLSDRLSRWVTKMAPYTFDIIHRKGKSNIVPDALSRMYEGEKVEKELAVKTNEDENCSLLSEIETCVLECVPTETDEWYVKMMNRVSKKDPFETHPFIIRNGQLFIKFQPRPGKTSDFIYKKVVPESWKFRVMKEGHCEPTAAHLGTAKTRKRISQRYFWPNMSTDIKDFCKQCVVCLQSKSRNGVKNQGLMGKFKFTNAPFQMISMDFVGPLARTTQQNTVMLVVTDWFSKFVSIFPLRMAKAKKVVEILEKDIFLVYGVPEIVIMDNGRQFVSKELMKLFKEYNICKIWYNSYYHPQNNFTERYNRTLGNCLRAFVEKDHRHWDVNIPKIQLALRTAVHAVTGYTPYYLNFGREYVGSGDDYHQLKSSCKVTPKQYSNFLKEFSKISSEVQRKMYEAYAKNKKYYDRNRVEVSFEAGDLVYRKNFAQANASQYISSKLLPKYIRLYVKKKTSETTYDLEDVDGRFVGNYHVQDFFKATSLVSKINEEN